MTPTRPGTALVLAALFTGVFAGLAPAADLSTLSGRKVSGTLTRVDAQAVTLTDETGAETKVPVKEVAAVDLGNKVLPPTKDAKFDEVELTDATVLLVIQVKVKGKAVEVTPFTVPNGPPPPAVALPLGAMFSLLRGADSPKNRDDWKALLGKRGKRDLFVIRGADGLQAIPGTVVEGDETGDRLTFEREDTGGRGVLPLTRASGGLVFNQPPRDVIPPTACKVLDVYGNVLFATAVEVAGPGLKVVTVSGATVSYPDAKAVSKLDFSQGNVTYLSDLIAKVEAAPPEAEGPLGQAYPYAPAHQVDKALGGGDILLGGRRFAKGLSLPPDTAFTCKLDGQYRELKLTAGILDGVKPDNAALKLRIEIDGRPVVDETVSKKDPPKDLNLNVKDAKELRVSVEGGPLFFGNQLNLGDARVQK